MAERWISFDCYGTLIDWERGITDALLPLLPADTDREALARRYIEIEAEVERERYIPYREVLDRAGRALLREHGVEGRSPLPASLPSWQPFREVPAALRALREKGHKLAILSNVDRELLDHSIAAIGVAPDLAVTAQDCGSYKPAKGHWERFLRETKAEPRDTIHVGASQYHDIGPAGALGFRTVFVDRHGERLMTEPTRVIRDLSTLPDVVAELT
ncbi:MAG TPA: HAD family hydrolase [Candidatus Limnocylindria bacterium]|nr:HAD family hydrolase [Candidatus Limnocylindria bacterium]